MDSRRIPAVSKATQVDAMVETLWRRHIPTNHRVYIIKALTSIYRQFYKIFQEALDQGIQKDCFATKFFEIADDLGFNQDQQMFVAGTLIEAGRLQYV